MSDTMQDVLSAARLLFRAGDVVEVRVPKAGKQRTIAGYFDDFETLAQAVQALEFAKYPGVYWTINQIDPALLARAKNKTKGYAASGDLTSDDNVLRRRCLPVDLDPTRPAGISSTDAQHEAALAHALHVQAELVRDGWPEGIYADSGNGAHLLYQIDLPNDPESRDLVKRVLQGLAARFDTREPNVLVEVDQTMFNASRILKIYGTTARKGEDMPDRPHRLSRILQVPALLETVTIELLQAQAAVPPAKAFVPSRSTFRPGGKEFDLEEFLGRHGVRYRARLAYEGGWKYQLEECPFDSAHKYPDSCVFHYPDGYAFRCLHNSCRGHDWREFRQLFEPDAYRGGSAGRQFHAPHPADSDVPPALPTFEDDEDPLNVRDVKAAVDEAITRGDLDAVLLLVPEIAQLPALVVLRIKTALVEKFKKKFRAKDFEAALREERRRAIAGLPPEDASLPMVIVNNRPMRDVVADSLQALRAANDPPFLFVRSGQMVFVEIDERQRPSIQAVEKAHLRGRLDRASNYIRRGAESDISVPPPLEVVEDILALPSAEWGVPPLEFVVEVPTLRPDGTVLSSPGYDPISRMLYAPALGFKMEAIPDYVDSELLKEAIGLIDEAIGDFPYAEEKDDKGAVMIANPNRANLFGLLLTPIVRPAIAGVVPLALIDAPQAGTGKSLLVDLFSVITTGRTAAMMPFPRNEEEMQKSIGSTLLAGRALVCFDNIEGILQSPTLALVITAKEYEARILGLSENMVAPNRATWVATGNNIRPSGDMPRRCYHIRLDAKKSRPYQGRKFKHENLLAWALEVRPQLLRSLLIISRAWYQRKVKLPPTDLWGSFEEWHRTIAGILRSAGVDGFLANLQAFLVEGDDMALNWEGFLSELESAYGTEWFRVGKIVNEIRSGTPLDPARFTLPDSLGDVDRRKEGGLERALGKSFAKRLGTRFGEREMHLERRIDKHTKQAEWRVLAQETEALAGKADPAQPPRTINTETSF